MKQLVRVIFILVLVGSGFSCLQAGAKANTPEQREALVEKKVDHLTKKLKLTSDQETQVRSLIQDKMDKEQQARDEANAKIRALLTPDQLSKYNDFTD